MKSRFSWLILFLSSFLVVGLAACGGGNGSSTVLPLADGKPTFLYFYTDNWPSWTQMTPIVDGLETKYEDRIAFVHINAGNGDGVQLFRQLGLPGHPSYVIFSIERQETFRAFGVVDVERLTNAIEATLRWCHSRRWGLWSISLR